MSSLLRVFQGTTVQLFQQLQAEMEKRRNDQMATFKRAKQHKILASFGRAQPDKLSSRYPWKVAA